MHVFYTNVVFYSGFTGLNANLDVHITMQL